MNILRLEKEANFEQIRQIKRNLNELIESKSMLYEEISGKLIQRADYFAQLEFLELKEMQLKQDESEEIRFFFEEQFLNEKIAGCKSEIILKNSKEKDLNNELSSLNNQIISLINKNKSLQISINYKQKERNHRFNNDIEHKKQLQSVLEYSLKCIFADDLFNIISKTTELLFENLDEMNEIELKNLLCSEKILEDIQRYFNEKNIAEKTRINVIENIQIYYDLLKNYAEYRNFFF